MSTLIEELIKLTLQASELTTLPRIARVILPPAFSADAHKYSKFGLMVLEDDSAGFFYRLLEQPEWDARYSTAQLDAALSNMKGVNPASLARGLQSPDPLARGLGMAAVNAISQHVFSKAGYRPSAVQRTPLNSEQRIGMIGFFSPMVASFQQAGICTTVIELDESLYQETDTLLVTGDRDQLRHCATVFCTASTLLNNTLDTILQELAHKPHFELIGPTCGCFADPFFKRGVSKIGGSVVVDAAGAAAQIQALQPWGESVQKYEIDATSYPGFDALAGNLG